MKSIVIYGYVKADRAFDGIPDVRSSFFSYFLASIRRSLKNILDILNGVFIPLSLFALPLRTPSETLRLMQHPQADSSRG